MQQLIEQVVSESQCPDGNEKVSNCTTNTAWFGLNPYIPPKLAAEPRELVYTVCSKLGTHIVVVVWFSHCLTLVLYLNDAQMGVTLYTYCTLPFLY